MDDTSFTLSQTMLWRVAVALLGLACLGEAFVAHPLSSRKVGS